MHTPTSHEILSAWEVGRNRHPIDRAILLLWLAIPNADENFLREMSIGDRNRRLLDWYEELFGAQLDCYFCCQECKAANEFTVPINKIRFEPLPPSLKPLHVEGYRFCIRQPNSRDLAAAARQSDVVEARRLLIRQCILPVECDDDSRLVSDLPDVVVSAVSDALREQDPQVDLHFEVTCNRCERSSLALFDVVTFAWNELAHLAKQTLRDVHRLASVYGWQESEILSMSSQRRRSYLELVGE